MVSSEHQRQMAAFVVAGELCSGRTACRCLRLARSSFQYRLRPPTTERTRLVQRLHELSRKYPRYGFRRIAVKLRREGYKVGRKQVKKSGEPKGCGCHRPGFTAHAEVHPPGCRGRRTVEVMSGPGTLSSKPRCMVVPCVRLPAQYPPRVLPQVFPAA